MSTVAAIVAIALHAMLMTSMLWGPGPQKRPAQPRGPGALEVAAPESADDGALQVFFIQEVSSSASSTDRHASKAARSPKLAPLPLIDPLADLSLELPQVSAEDPSSAADLSVDSATRSAMYGRYLGQISARIRRAWLRPRSAIGAPIFSCRVRIDQDARGNVEDVTLEDCNGDRRWQVSLVQAIESASPLPAPPDRTVFTRVVHAYFEGRAYGPGAPEAEYEPTQVAREAALAVDPERNERALSDFGQALRKSHGGKAISLTLSESGNLHHSSPPPPSSNQGSDSAAPGEEIVPARPPGEPNP